MARLTPLWEQAGTYPAASDRRLVSALWPAGGVTGFEATASGGMGVSLAAGSGAVPSANATGSVLCVSDAAEAVVIGGAPPSGQNRIDVITLQPRGTDLDGGANNDWVFNVIAGAVAATPVAPAVPVGQLAVWRVYVGGGVAALVQSNLTDVRPFGLAAGNGAAGRPPVTTGATTQSFTDQHGVTWVARNGVNGGAWRRARDVLTSVMGRNAAWTTAVAVAAFGFDMVIRDPYVMAAGAPTTWTVPVAGLYRFRANLACTATATGQFLTTALRQNAQTFTNSQAMASGAQRIDIASEMLVLCAAGDTFQVMQSASVALAGSAAAFGVTPCIASLNYEGTG
jgi:hypothetical protein